MSQIPIHFVISAPRSGSTWLTKALNHHPEIFATEHRLFGEFAEVWQNNDGSSSPRMTFDSYAKAFSVHYFHDELGFNQTQFVNQLQKSFVNFIIGFAARRANAKVVVDKITPYPGTASLVIEKIRNLFPDSKVIQLVRDGRDVLTSGAFDWLLKDAQGTNRYAHFVDQEKGHILNRFFDDELIQKWATNWSETLEIFADSKADVQISYESMKSSQPQELQKMFELIGVDTSDSIAQTCANETTFEKLTGRAEGELAPTAKARSGIAGDWRTYFTQQDAQMFANIAGDWLIKYGYEVDNQWIEGCPNELTLKN